jgi:hypothetical protein
MPLMRRFFSNVRSLTRVAVCALAFLVLFCRAVPALELADTAEPPAIEHSAPPTADQITLIQILLVVAAVLVLLTLAWLGINERHRSHKKHHHRREKRRKLFDFIEIKK